MTEDEALAKLQSIHSVLNGDPEAMHGEEDDLMLDIIASFGWTRFVSAHKDADVTRWFS